MMHTTQKSGKPKIRRYVGMLADSRALGVHRTTLYRVLRGEWHLPGLLKRYHALKERQSLDN